MKSINNKEIINAPKTNCDIEITKISNKRIYDENFGRKNLVIDRGQITTRFDNIEDCIFHIEKEFDRLFDDKDWKMVESCTFTEWNEYKNKLLEIYK